MIYPQEQREDSENVSVLQSINDTTIQKFIKPRKIKKNVPQPLDLKSIRSQKRENARKKWKLLQAVFLTVHRLQKHEVISIDSPIKLHHEMTNYTSPIKSRIQQCSFDAYEYSPNIFVQCAEDGSTKSIARMLQIINLNPKKYLYSSADERNFINARNTQGQNALYVACKLGNQKVVELLLQHGVNQLIKSKISQDQWEDPITVAVRWSHTVCVQLLLDNHEYEQSALVDLKKLTKNKDILRILNRSQISWWSCCFY
ncbi:hypothetical protein pb186bvf_004123 [Paramecium bursaria]